MRGTVYYDDLLLLFQLEFGILELGKSSVDASGSVRQHETEAG